MKYLRLGYMMNGSLPSVTAADIRRLTHVNLAFGLIRNGVLDLGMLTNLPLTEAFREWNPEVDDMLFYELPFRDVEDFDYAEIAGRIEESGAEVIWVALGAPKQELFMARLKPYLRRGVMIAVGAVFKFYSGVDEKRAPDWMVGWHMEWVYRIMGSPKKQLRRCGMILYTLPRMLREEYRRKRAAK